MASVLTAQRVIDLLSSPPTLVPVFAYGTLRPGEALHGFVDVMRSEPATAYGYSLWAAPGGHYPWMTRGHGGQVSGDLIWCDANMALVEIARMEMRSGYDAALINVYTDTISEPVPALAFVAHAVPYSAQRINSGDWRARD